VIIAIQFTAWLTGMRRWNTRRHQAASVQYLTNNLNFQPDERVCSTLTLSAEYCLAARPVFGNQRNRDWLADANERRAGDSLRRQQPERQSPALRAMFLHQNDTFRSCLSTAVRWAGTYSLPHCTAPIPQISHRPGAQNAPQFPADLAQSQYW